MVFKTVHAVIIVGMLAVLGLATALILTVRMVPTDMNMRATRSAVLDLSNSMKQDDTRHFLPAADRPSVHHVGGGGLRYSKSSEVVANTVYGGVAMADQAVVVVPNTPSATAVKHALKLVSAHDDARRALSLIRPGTTVGQSVVVVLSEDGQESSHNPMLHRLLTSLAPALKNTELIQWPAGRALYSD